MFATAYLDGSLQEPAYRERALLSDRFAEADMVHCSGRTLEPRPAFQPLLHWLARWLVIGETSSNEPLSALTDHAARDAAEQAQRQREVDFARGSVRYEGGILSDDIKRFNARYIAGEIDSDELTATALASDTARSYRLA